MHCDCVNSFVDAVEEGEESHDSASDDDDYDDGLDHEWDDTTTTNPSKKRKDPWGAADPGVLISKTDMDVDVSVDTPTPGKKEKGSLLPNFTNPFDVMQNYYGKKGNEIVPRPFITTPRNQELINLGMPVNTDPYNPNNDDFTNKLWTWYDSLSPENKQLYNGACFVTSDPKDSAIGGKQVGNVGDVNVIFKENPSGSKSKYEYSLEFEDGTSEIILSDIRLPDRAFDGKEAFETYFFKDGEYWRPRYKIGQSRAGRKDPFYEGDDMGSRMARNPNQWKEPEEPSPISANPEIAEPDDPKPVLTNNTNNTRALTGDGTKGNPFLCSLGSVNSTKWATFTNCAVSGGGGYGISLLKARDNQGDPLFGVRWYSSATGNFNAYIMLHEMVNRNGTNSTFAVCGFTAVSTATHTITMNCLTPSNINSTAPADNTNAVFHEILVNDVVVRSLSDTSDFTIPVTANVPFTVKAIVRCDPDDIKYDRSSGGFPYVIWWPKGNLLNLELTVIWQCVKKNSLVAVGEPDAPPGNPQLLNGENVSWGSECPTSYLARNNGTLPNNSPMVLTDDILSKMLVLTKVGSNSGRANFYDASGTLIRSRVTNFAGNGFIVPFIQSNNTGIPVSFSFFVRTLPNLSKIRMYNFDNTAQTNDIYEREYSYVVYNNEWQI